MRRTLGASPATAVRRIALLLAWPGFAAGGLSKPIGLFEEFDVAPNFYAA
jgi:ABC-type spermidine/putrescine transport system permease subunit II